MKDAACRCLSRSNNRHQQLLWRRRAAKLDEINDMLDVRSTGLEKAYTEKMATQNRHSIHTKKK